MNDFGSNNNIQASFRQAMRDAGLSFDGELVADGSLHRIKANDDHAPNSWYVLHGDGGIPNGIFGCWKSGVNGQWCSKPLAEFTKEEKAAYCRQVDESKRKRDADLAQSQAEASAKAKVIIDAAQPATDDHGYLTSKVVSAYPGVMVGDWPQRNAKDCVLIPFTASNALATVQAISATGALIGDSSKDWLIGGRKAGASFVIGDLATSELIVIGEGYATVASIHESTGLAVVMAGDCGNLLPVAKSIRSQWPKKRLVVAADDDRDTEGNPGLTKARIACEAVKAALVVPGFTDEEVGKWRQCHKEKAPTDFNDLRVIRGLDGVRAVFNTTLVSSEQPEVDKPDKDYLLVKTDDKNNESLIHHNEAAEILYREEFKSLLYYDPVTLEWYQYQDTGIFRIRPDLSIQQTVYRAINRHCGNLGFSASYVSGVAKCLLFESIKEPTTPIGKVCFVNGVLDLESRQLVSHSPRYFFNSQLPFEWQPTAPDPQVVIDWLKEATGNNDDQVQLLRAWFHAVIIGRPDLQCFLEVIGFGGSGKGTLIRLCMAIVGREATHSTMLKQLEENRFETAKIFGKKLVVITDAEKWHGDVSVLKSITGQDPIRFEEKNKQSGDSFTFGGMVLIAANQHTTSTDYSSGIQRRRITVAFDHVVPSEQRRDLDSEFEPLLTGVVKWALDMPTSEVTAYLRSTSNRVRSLKTVRMETLAATNPIVGWLLDCVAFVEEAETQVGTKERLTITTGSRDEDKTTRQEYEHWKTRLYPNYATWCDRSGKQPISLQVFARTVIDASKNLLGKPFVKKTRQAQGSMIKGLSLVCKPNEDLSADYLIDNVKNVDCVYSEKVSNFQKGQSDQTARPPEESGVNLAAFDRSLHSQHFHINQDFKQHSGQHNVSTVQTGDSWEEF